jgi:[phosphatase 2A protein]-leucine-carboxy methyltransferase
MSAPSIPNLLTLKKNGKSATSGAGRGRSTPLRDPLADSDAEASTSSENLSRKQNDAIVQSTDTDANISRLSAVHAGYLQDPFAQDFTPPGEVPRRFPIINRGM